MTASTVGFAVAGLAATPTGLDEPLDMLTHTFFVKAIAVSAEAPQFALSWKRCAHLKLSVDQKAKGALWRTRKCNGSSEDSAVVEPPSTCSADCLTSPSCWLS
jgi:hypothetical protein